MNEKEFLRYIETLQVKPESSIRLDKIATDAEHDFIDKASAEELILSQGKELAELQEKLYAHNRFNILIVVQAMDAAGKDSAIRQVAGAFNPAGLHVTSFKVPAGEELDHDYLWRHVKALPMRGDIAVWNRSHYENVLVTRVHPEYLLHENIPGIESPKDANDSFWKMRFKQINHWEKSLAENGTLILKFFFHVSKEEQLKRFLDRIDTPSKNWKFNLQDLEERKLWPEYMQAYEEMISETSTKEAPWHILPADDKWFTRICMNTIILQAFRKLPIDFPKLNADAKKELALARQQLTEEKKSK